MSPDDYLIHELADQAKVSVRTIRYYIDQGLLPAPDARGRYASYSQEYLDRLELIRRLKEAYLPLKEIRERISGLSGAQVKEMLARLEAEPPVASQAEQPEIQLHEKSANYALRYIQQALDAQNQMMSEDQPTPMQSLRSPVMPAPSPSSRRADAGQNWQRIPLADGLELHVRQPVDPEIRARVQQILVFASSLFPDRP